MPRTMNQNMIQRFTTGSCSKNGATTTYAIDAFAISKDTLSKQMTSKASSGNELMSAIPFLIRRSTIPEAKVAK